VLSPEECEQLIFISEKIGFEQRQFEGNRMDSSSCVVWCPELADAIFTRLQPHLLPESYFDGGLGVCLEDIDFDNQVITHWGTLDSCNPSVRVERYDSGQHLKVHRDGCVLVKGKQHTYTVYAVLIYLNRGYEGGCTQFVTSKTPVSPNDLYSFIDLHGSTGDALLFRHELIHKGGTVTNGRKYVLRLDIAYKLKQ